MHLDSTIAALKSADGYPPVDAVQSAIALAETLAPAISGVLDLAASGGTLTKDEENLIFSGLYALAEARCASVFPALLRFLNGPSMTIEGVFDEDFMHLSGLLVSLADTDTAPLFALARNGDILEEVRSAAISALARLVWEGRADPDAFVSVLDDFDREQERIPAVFTYFAWAEAILSLRLRALIPRVRKAFEAELLPFDELDWQEWLDEMEKPEQHFAAEPIDSAETALSFFKEREPHALEISPGRLGWLSRALLIPAATGQCLPFEMVDGFFTGVACGPPPRPSFADVIGEIWTETTPEEIFRRTEVQQDVEALLRQRFYSIGRRLAKGIPPQPFFSDGEGSDRARLWARGFAQAIMRNSTAWEPLAENQAGQGMLQAIVFPAGVPDRRESRRTAKLRGAASDGLGDLALEIRQFWTDGPPDWAVRAVKPGRNDPCPCGSGKKFKKCCRELASPPKRLAH